jgi:hypothetical protein
LRADAAFRTLNIPVNSNHLMVRGRPTWVTVAILELYVVDDCRFAAGIATDRDGIHVANVMQRTCQPLTRCVCFELALQRPHRDTQRARRVGAVPSRLVQSKMDSSAFDFV